MSRDLLFPYFSNVNLEEFHSQLPPNQALSQEQCEELLPQMLAITWASSWMKAIERGETEFISEEFTRCVREQKECLCGESCISGVCDADLLVCIESDFRVGE